MLSRRGQKGFMEICMYSVTLRLIQKFLTEWVHVTVIQKLDRDL